MAQKKKFVVTVSTHRKEKKKAQPTHHTLSPTKYYPLFPFLYNIHIPSYTPFSIHLL